jgi:DNA-binding response OmpR family regulator
MKHNRILIVEDEEFLIDSYLARFSLEKFELKIARNGNEALSLFDTFHPNLIILDLIMSQKDGLTVLQALKHKSLPKPIPVIVATNLYNPKIIKKALALGASDYFVKSNISINELVAVCKKYLSIPN